MPDTLTRRYAAADLELRDGADGAVALEGYASTFSQPYSMGSFQEEVTPGAFKRSLSRKPDLPFLVNHDGTPLARTASKTLTLSEDSTGLHVRAFLDPANPAAAAVISAVGRKDLTAMSFAFRVGKGGDAWNEDYTHRSLNEVNIDGGDVSVVTYPANPSTSIGLRAEDEAAAKAERYAAILDDAALAVRSGAALAEATLAALLSLTADLGGADLLAARTAAAEVVAPEATTNGRALDSARRLLQLAELR